MAVKEPQITFLVPLRIFTEDKEFTAVNLSNWAWKQIGGKSEEALEMLESVTVYSIVLALQANKPVDIPFSKIQAQRVFKDIFPNGKCIRVDVDYTQHKSRTMLPVIDFRIFFKANI